MVERIVDLRKEDVWLREKGLVMWKVEEIGDDRIWNLIKKNGERLEKKFKVVNEMIIRGEVLKKRM